MVNPGLLCPQMIGARTALHIAPWWSRLGSASTPITQPPAAALAPTSWSAPRWSRPESGSKRPLILTALVPTDQPMLYPWLSSLSHFHLGYPPGRLKVVRRWTVAAKTCGWVCVCGVICAPAPSELRVICMGVHSQTGLSLAREVTGWKSVESRQYLFP